MIGNLIFVCNVEETGPQATPGSSSSSPIPGICSPVSLNFGSRITALGPRAIFAVGDHQRFKNKFGFYDAEVTAMRFRIRSPVEGESIELLPIGGTASKGSWICKKFSRTAIRLKSHASTTKLHIRSGLNFAVPEVSELKLAVIKEYFN